VAVAGSVAGMAKEERGGRTRRAVETAPTGYRHEVRLRGLWYANVFAFPLAIWLALRSPSPRRWALWPPGP